MAAPSLPDDQLTLSLRPPGTGAADVVRQHLLVFEAGTSWQFPLPASGEVRIGRAADVDLRLSDETTSRNHARLVIGEAGVHVEDLGSHNGTRVNGEPIEKPRLLGSGDVVSICSAMLVFHRDALSPSTRAIVDAGQLRQRLEEEVERARLYQRSLALIAVRFAGAVADRPRVTAALAGQVRLIDVAGWVGPTELLLLLPELDEERAARVADRLLAALAPATASKVGFVTVPADGDDADVLIRSARAAAASSRGLPATAASSCTSFTIGGREIRVADPAMHRVYALTKKLAASDLSVLIHGENGVGKESVAVALHEWSRRSGGPWVVQNCAALPETLVEGLLFGSARGAYTDAVTARAGLLESASGGTLFLDEIGELAPAVQAKLLRAIETQRVLRLGEVKERPIDLRLITATNRDLDADVAAGRFRRDLLHRLGPARIVIPPLRDRRNELPVLARALLAEACVRAKRAPMTLSTGAMQAILGHRWPGNVRELLGALSFVAATVDEDVVEPWHLPESVLPAKTAYANEDVPASPAVASGSEPGAPPRFRRIDEEVRELERSRMAAALEATGGHRRKAAEAIGMPLRTFVTKLSLYGLGGRTPDDPG